MFRQLCLIFVLLVTYAGLSAHAMSVPPQTTIFSQPNIQDITNNFYYWPQSPLPEGNFYLTQNFPSPLGADSQYSNNLGTFTGFYPVNPYNAQMTINPNWWGGTSLQGEGYTAGIMINSDSNLSANTQWPTLFPVVASYNFETQTPIRPWSSDMNAGLIYSIDLQVPQASASDQQTGNGHSSAAYATGNFIIQDMTTGVGFWYGASFYDHRGANAQNTEGVHLDDWNHGTGAPVVGAVVLEPGQITPTNNKFGTAVWGSQSYQSQTWTGYRRLSFAITGTNLLNAINTIRQTYPQFQSTLTTNVANYAVIHTNYNPELYYDGAFGFIATSFQNYNVRVASSLPLPFFRMYSSKIGRHFYTTSPTETRSMLNGGWVLEGNAGQLYNDHPANTNLTALYRLHRNSDGDYFYTTSQVEEGEAEKIGYTYQLIAGYLPTSTNCSVNLYRIFTNGGHFYTTSQAEAQGAGTVEAVYCINP